VTRAPLPRFLAQLAHDLRSPLNVVGGALRELKPGPLPQSGGDRAALLALGERAVTRMLVLADRLALASRVSDGLSPGLERCDLVALTQRAIATFSATSLRKKLALTAALPAHEVIVRADAELMLALLSELLSNASRHARRNVKVELTVDDGVTVSIDDDGPGIAAAERGRLFEPFADRIGQVGLGMGLWLARSLAELHGGTVSLEPLTPGTRQRLHLQRAT
jgi:signal transduction histidine kinase